MQQFSLLDLSPVPEGGDAALALANTLDLARHAEALGYHRYWLAEHHNMPGIASAATAVVLAHVAAGTQTIRLGAGGIMLPNHAPLVVAEQFGTLATLHPGRIDLGLGRAPGTDMATARTGSAPLAGTRVPVWILGSSLFGAQLAAYLGLPFAFASHFAPAMLEQALAIYRRDFRPSPRLERPHAMIAAGVFAADTDEEAHFLRSSQLLAFARLRTGRPGKLPPPSHDLSDQVPPAVMAQVRAALSVSATGAPETLHRELSALLDRYRPDELIITGMIHDHGARRHSTALAAQVLQALRKPAMAA